VSYFKRRVAVEAGTSQPEDSLERQLNQIEKKERRWHRLMKWLIWGILVAIDIIGNKKM
jgi:hypothetical protein